MTTSKQNTQSPTKAGAGKGTQGGTPEQHAEAGRHSHDNQKSEPKGASVQSASGDNTPGDSASHTGIRGGTPDQHAEAGRHSHDGKNASGGKSNATPKTGK